MNKQAINIRFQSSVVNLMKNLDKWEENLLKEIPTSWENYGGFLIFSSPAFSSSIWKEMGPVLWETVCSCLKGHSVAIKGRISRDEFRSPQAQLVYGESPIVTFLDNGIRYSWNVEKNMFCAGNVTERHRIAGYDCRGEIIVDLFAGIGYFTLPYLVHAKADLVHACDWNPVAIEALRRNVHLNKVEEKCKIYEGDNRKVCPKKVADRVNLGLIPSSEDYLGVGCEALRESGGILYIHSNVTSGLDFSSPVCQTCLNILDSNTFKIEKKMLQPVVVLSNDSKTGLKFKYGGDAFVQWKHPEWFKFSIHILHVLLDCFSSLYESPWSVMVEEVFHVKSYAPHIDHLVYSVVCRPSR